ncbi:hypothetical protein EV384_0937 [Micromonospora kangleipakensis]|uniref:Uncharacterized protein n=1 Tax=Micromonospora kangleipakensis TaxID=1077942 RepID=A0A4V2GCN0_9ACTN|nr:hypothetical protein EV384_0937 [Micromonospora kangleipakensis]
MIVGSGSGSGNRSGPDERVGIGLGDGLGDSLGDGSPPPAEGVGQAAPVGGAGGTGVRGRMPHAESDATGGAGAAAISGAPGRVTSGAGRVVDVTSGWLVAGSGITTGPTEGVGMNGVLLSGSAVLPTVADPVLMAARIGIDAVPASSATVKR